MVDTAQQNPSPVKEGEILAGKYQVERVLGVGGMGVVVAARHIQLGQRVALKFLLPEACAYPEAVERFLREARAAVQIQSEHVARVSDVGTLESGMPFMVMEFLEGTDLEKIVRGRGALPIAEVADFVLQACEAIAEAHALGIVHRDLKPANLFVTQRADGSSLVKVLDFGISKARSPGMGGASMTATSSVMGSPFYMSPEQMRSSKNVDHRTDIWSIGVILFELLTARPVFEAETIPDLCVRIATEPIVPIRQKRADVPAELEAMILRCLERDLNKRFQNVAELAQALLPFAPKSSKLSVERVTRVIRGSGMYENVLSLPPTSESPPGVGTVGGWGNTQPGARAGRSKVIGLSVLAGVLVLGMGIGVVLFRGRDTTARMPAGAMTESAVPSQKPSDSVASALANAPSAQAPQPSVATAASASPTATPIQPVVAVTKAGSKAVAPSTAGNRPAAKPSSKGGQVDPLADQR